MTVHTRIAVQARHPHRRLAVSTAAAARRSWPRPQSPSQLVLTGAPPRPARVRSPHSSRCPTRRRCRRSWRSRQGRLAAGAFDSRYALPAKQTGPTLASVLASMGPGRTQRHTEAIMSLTFARSSRPGPPGRRRGDNRSPRGRSRRLPLVRRARRFMVESRVTNPMPISQLPRGTLIVDYRVEAVLGRGGMSVVYLAEDLRLKRHVALKLLTPTLAEDARFRERFLSESELAASLDHANVIPIYEAGEADGPPLHRDALRRGIGSEGATRRRPTLQRGGRHRGRWRSAVLSTPPTSAAWCTAT